MFQDRGGAPDITVYKTADETVASSIALQADNHLIATNLRSSRKYVGRFVLYVAEPGSLVNGGLRIGFTGPSVDNFRGFLTHREDHPSNTSLVFTGMALSSLSDTFVYSAAHSDPTDIMVTIEFEIEPSANGDLTLTWAQEASSSTATTMKKGSNLLVWRVA
jgi:hypothetical protein